MVQAFEIKYLKNTAQKPRNIIISEAVQQHHGSKLRIISAKKRVEASVALSCILGVIASRRNYHKRRWFGNQEESLDAQFKVVGK